MKIVEMNWHPTDRQLRQFGLIALVALPGLGWLWHLGMPATQVLAAFGIVAATAALIYPRALKYPFVVLCLLSLPFGIVLGEVILLLSFVTIFVPLAFVFRCLGRDALQRGFDPNASTYWQPKAAPAGPGSYLRQS
jgi:saxitoxin biosynthesis operon SxtJ-like protein